MSIASQRQRYEQEQEKKRKEREALAFNSQTQQAIVERQKLATSTIDQVGHQLPTTGEAEQSPSRQGLEAETRRRESAQLDHHRSDELSQQKSDHLREHQERIEHERSLNEMRKEDERQAASLLAVRQLEESKLQAEKEKSHTAGGVSLERGGDDTLEKMPTHEFSGIDTSGPSTWRESAGTLVEDFVHVRSLYGAGTEHLHNSSAMQPIGDHLQPTSEAAQQPSSPELAAKAANATSEPIQHTTKPAIEAAKPSSQLAPDQPLADHAKTKPEALPPVSEAVRPGQTEEISKPAHSVTASHTPTTQKVDVIEHSKQQTHQHTSDSDIPIPNLDALQSSSASSRQVQDAVEAPVIPDLGSKASTKAIETVQHDQARNAAKPVHAVGTEAQAASLQGTATAKPVPAIEGAKAPPQQEAKDLTGQRHEDRKSGTENASFAIPTVSIPTIAASKPSPEVVERVEHHHHDDDHSDGHAHSDAAGHDSELPGTDTAEHETAELDSDEEASSSSGGNQHEETPEPVAPQKPAAEQPAGPTPEQQAQSGHEFQADDDHDYGM